MYFQSYGGAQEGTLGFVANNFCECLGLRGRGGLGVGFRQCQHNAFLWKRNPIRIGSQSCIFSPIPGYMLSDTPNVVFAKASKTTRSFRIFARSNEECIKVYWNPLCFQHREPFLFVQDLQFFKGKLRTCWRVSSLRRRSCSFDRCSSSWRGFANVFGFCCVERQFHNQPSLWVFCPSLVLFAIHFLHAQESTVWHFFNLPGVLQRVLERCEFQWTNTLWMLRVTPQILLQCWSNWTLIFGKKCYCPLWFERRALDLRRGLLWKSCR